MGLDLSLVEGLGVGETVNPYPTFTHMKSTNRFLATLVIAGTLLLQNTFSETSASQREVAVVSESIRQNKTQALAQGFVDAFEKLKGVNKTLVLQYGENLKQIDEVRSVARVGSVLVVKNRKLKSFIVNPEDVLFFTDDSSVSEIH